MARRLRGDALALALLVSVAATATAMLVLLAYQGHGWGYRYLHGAVPAVLVLCGFGYRAWHQRAPGQAARSSLFLAGVSAVLVVFLLVSANRFVAPYAALTQLIDRQTADFVILETEPPGSAIDQVRNDPDFANRPLTLSSVDLDMAQVRELCGRGTVTFLRKSAFALMPFGTDPGYASEPYVEMERYLAGQRCWREPTP